MSRTRLGTQVYAVGGNINAAHLSAGDIKRTLMLTYIICAQIASLTGLLLTACVDSGEVNLGGINTLGSIAACVTTGVPCAAAYGGSSMWRACTVSLAHMAGSARGPAPLTVMHLAAHLSMPFGGAPIAPV